MTPELTKPQAVQDQLSDLNETLEKEKVELTQEVEKYTRDHVRTVHNKLQAGKPVYENELAFIPKVKMWVMMPKNVREKFPSIEKMQSEQPEANKRHISLKQWLDLLHVVDAAKKNEEWIDETFEFTVGGKIKVNGYLDLNGCTGLTKLPDGLSVRGDLILSGCTGLTELPEGLKVGGSLFLYGCTGPTKLPEELKVDGDLVLSENSNEQVKKDAERLKVEGKIEGEIQYY